MNRPVHAGGIGKVTRIHEQVIQIVRPDGHDIVLGVDLKLRGDVRIRQSRQQQGIAAGHARNHLVGGMIKAVVLQRVTRKNRHRRNPRGQRVTRRVGRDEVGLGNRVGVGQVTFGRRKPGGGIGVVRHPRRSQRQDIAIPGIFFGLRVAVAQDARAWRKARAMRRLAGDDRLDIRDGLGGQVGLDQEAREPQRTGPL